MTRRLVSPIPFLALLIALSTVSAAAADPPGGPRLLAKLPGPAGTAAAFSRDGKLLLTAGGDEARVWDAETFTPVTGPLRHAAGEKIVLAALDAQVAAVLTVAAGEARLWDAVDGRHLHTFHHASGGRVTFAAFSPDGSTVVTAGTDRTARLWDARTRQQVRVLKHDLPVKYAAFARTGDRLVTIAEEWHGHATARVTFSGVGGASVWDARTGEKLARRDADTNTVFADGPSRRPVAFNADGSRVISIYTWIAEWWDASTGRHVAEVDGRAEYLGWELGSASVFAVSADGTRLAIAGHVALGVWELREGLDEKRPLAKFNISGIDDIHFSPDGRRLLVAADRDGSGVWDAASGIQVLAIRPQRENERAAPAVAFSPDGKRVAAAFASDGFTSIWEVPDHKQP